MRTKKYPLSEIVRKRSMPLAIEAFKNSLLLNDRFCRHQVKDVLQDLAQRWTIPFHEILNQRIGPFEKRIGIFGDFSALWGYIDYVSRLVKEKGYIAITAKNIYEKVETRRTKESISIMGDISSLLYSFFLTAVVSKAIVIENLPSTAQFETAFLDAQNKETLGVVITEDIYRGARESCMCLKDRKDYSVCMASSMAETKRNKPAELCSANRNFCPFKGTQMKFSTLEIYLENNNMYLVAVNKLESLVEIVDAFLRKSKRIVH